MSDFIRNIVNEVLHRGSEAQPSKPSVNSTDVLASIKRPNYQQQKKGERLSPIKSNSKLSTLQPLSKGRSTENNSITENNDTASTLDRFPSLVKITMSPMNHTQSQTLADKHASSSSKLGAESIGTTKDRRY